MSKKIDSEIKVIKNEIDNIVSTYNIQDLYIKLDFLFR